MYKIVAMKASVLLGEGGLTNLFNDLMDHGKPMGRKKGSEPWRQEHWLMVEENWNGVNRVAAAFLTMILHTDIRRPNGTPATPDEIFDMAMTIPVIAERVWTNFLANVYPLIEEEIRAGALDHKSRRQIYADEYRRAGLDWLQGPASNSDLRKLFLIPVLLMPEDAAAWASLAAYMCDGEKNPLGAWSIMTVALAINPGNPEIWAIAELIRAETAGELTVE